MKYIVRISSFTTNEREYNSDSRNALALANKYGRCEYGETITVYNKSGKALSRAEWTSEDGGRYFRATI